MNVYIAPEPGKATYTCPHCGVLSLHKNFIGGLTPPGRVRPTFTMFTALLISQCVAPECEAYVIWFKKEMIYPDTGNAPLPNPDLPDDIKKDYMEARSIVGKSPRGAAALLRLCIQKLCKELGEKGKNINDDIESLVKKGLPERIQKALDSVRVIGNHAVHPGSINVDDDPDIAIALFELTNLVVEDRISSLKRVDETYHRLPPTVQEAIKKRK